MNASSLTDLLGGAQSAEDAVASIEAFFQKPVVAVASGALVALVLVALLRAADSHREELAGAARLVLV